MATKNEKLTLIVKIMAIGLLSVIPSCMVIPFMTVHLKSLGFSETIIGIYTAMPWIAMLFLSPFVTKITSRFGIRKIYIATGIINLLHCSVLILADNIYIIGISNFLFGFVWSLRWITTETLINDYAPEGKKGKAIGIYGTLICAFVAAGPLALLLTGVDTKLPLFVALVFFVISFVLTFSLPKLDYMKEEERVDSSFKLIVFPNFLLFFCGFIGGIFENGISAPAILYGISIGIEDKFSAIIPSVISGGTFLTQYMIGILTDKYRHKNLYLLISLPLVVFTLVTFLALTSPYLIYLPAFFWGAVGGGIYTMTLIHFGYKYTGTQLVAANAFLVIFYTIGSLIGPIIGGIALDAFPQYGFPVLLTAISVITLAASFKYKKV